MNPRRWLKKHSLRLLAIRDTPEAIAGGVAIGLFFGFTPLFGLKTILAIFCCWVSGSNILAAIIAGTLHDILLPIMPVVYYWQYGFGHWLLSSPHEWPRRLHHAILEGRGWRSWATIRSIGAPLMLGSVLMATPIAAVCFWVTRTIVARHHARRARRPAPVPEDEINPSPS